jgi:hypothetical protein
MADLRRLSRFIDAECQPKMHAMFAQCGETKIVVTMNARD